MAKRKKRVGFEIRWHRITEVARQLKKSLEELWDDCELKRMHALVEVFIDPLAPLDSIPTLVFSSAGLSKAWIIIPAEKIREARMGGETEITIAGVYDTPSGGKVKVPLFMYQSFQKCQLSSLYVDCLLPSSGAETHSSPNLISSKRTPKSRLHNKPVAKKYRADLALRLARVAEVALQEKAEKKDPTWVASMKHTDGHINFTRLSDHLKDYLQGMSSRKIAKYLSQASKGGLLESF